MTFPRLLPCLAALVACLALTSCAAQEVGPGGDEEPSPAIAAERAPDPEVGEPPECGSDSDCTLSVHTKPVASVEDCYCTGCPGVLSVATASAHRHGWNLHCREWAEDRECSVPMCAPPPGEAGCVDGRCRWRIDEGAASPREPT